MVLITYPNPILKKKAQAISLPDFGIRKLKKISDQMIQIMKKNKGVGLAAPQVGLGIRLCIISKEATGDGEHMILINPTIVERSVGKKTAEEGCLSLPDIQKNISRAARIKIKALNFDTETYALEADKLLARVIQHEIDHLDGILLIDTQP